jgi:cardiolipin synthase (CMP-forming)
MMVELPNLLTLSRISAIPAIVLLVALHNPACDLAASVLFGIAAFTDYLDGKLARSQRLVSSLGRMLDPIADKLLVGAVIMVLVGQGRLSYLGLYPSIVIVLREILVSGLREYLAELRVGLPATKLAKWKTGFQMVALGAALAGDTSARLIGIPTFPLSTIGEALLWLAASLTLLTGWDYLKVSWAHATSRPA